MEEWALERLLWVWSIWWPDARNEGLWKSKPLIASNVPSGSLTSQHPKIPLHRPAPPAFSATVLSTLALSHLRDPYSPSVSRWIHFSFWSAYPCSSPLPKPTPIPSSSKAHFWFPYKSWLWSVEVTWSHYCSSMRMTRGDWEWNCDSLEFPQRYWESYITVTLLFLLNIYDQPSVE